MRNKIKVGTTNEAKLKAVKDALLDYEFFSDLEVVPVVVSSGVKNQPMSLAETVKGAKNRAKRSFNDCELSIGIESGMMNVPGSKTGQMDVCVCSVYDGKNCHLGMSCAFELPIAVKKLVDEGLEITEAANKVGLSNNPKLGSAEGLIGILTQGRIKRSDYVKQAVIMAMIHIEQASHYKKSKTR